MATAICTRNECFAAAVAVALGCDTGRDDREADVVLFDATEACDQAVLEYVLGDIVKIGHVTCYGDLETHDRPVVASGREWWRRWQW